MARTDEAQFGTRTQPTGDTCSPCLSLVRSPVSRCGCWGISHMAAKTTCTISRSEFTQHAKPISIGLDGVNGNVAVPREFGTGSVGWYSTGKTMITVNGKPLMVQIGVT